MKRFLPFLLLFSLSLSAQNSAKSSAVSPAPKLVVGIVVDQMRHDYIYRYWEKYGNGGFKRLVKDGYLFRNAHYNYVPTYTGPGHASIYTGSTPAIHGIIANDWFLKNENKTTYCTEDPSVKPVGSESPAGLMSPKNLLCTTLGDELKLNTTQRAKVFAVALKDRSSILPAGHSANGAFWFDGSTGRFISSTHYMQALPAWLNEFNARQLAKTYLEKGWKTLLPLSAYTESLPDSNNYEAAPNQKTLPVFPYEYSAQLAKNSYEIIRATPYGNTITKDIALACLKGEGLGKDNITDLLCISFSSTDYVGHAYGPRSVEVEDVYLRLDKELEELLNALDAEVGKGNYTVFLTADHGACDVPSHLKDLKIPAGYVKETDIAIGLKQFCKAQFGDSLVKHVSNQQVFLDEDKMAKLKLDKASVELQLADHLLKYKGVAEAYPSAVIKFQGFTDESFKLLVQKGYNYQRSGNVVFTYSPAWMEFMAKGTTHGACYSYDTHVPVIFYGAKIPKGSSVRKINITDIAPTVSLLLNMAFPNGTTGKPLEELFR